MAQINLGTCGDDTRTLYKSISWNETDINVDVVDNRSIINPVFILNYTATRIKQNYLYCSDFGRYYTIDNITVEPGKRIALHCTVDVLQTYQAEISNLRVEISRQQNKQEPYLPDNNYVLLNDTDCEFYSGEMVDDIFSVPTSTSYNYLLSIAGNGHWTLPT